MKLLVLLSFAAGLATASTEARNCREDGGNWYCSPVQRIKYPNVGAEGSYDRVVAIDVERGKCDFEKQAFSGEMAPFDEDLSMHFRGPLVLKQFAVYKPNKSKRKRKEPPERPRHQHHAGHQGDVQKHGIAKKAVGDMVRATIDGRIVSWVNEHDGQAPASTAIPDTPKPTEGHVDEPIVKAVDAPTTTVTVTVHASDCQANALPYAAATTSTSLPSPAPSPASINPLAGSPALAPPAGQVDDTDWAQIACYDMDNLTAEGLVFLNNMGASGLTFAAADGASGADSARVFNGELKSQQEIAIFSDVSCDKGNCGFSRPKSTAYEGFAGANKAFFLEFSMPDDGGTSGFNVNMPGIWLLNGKVPRTQQYGACSCWATGCGEFDIFETLTPGDDRGKSTFHKRHAGGSSDYFIRPVDGFIQLAVIMSDNDITVQQLGSDFGFPQSISADEIASIHDDENIDSSITNSVYDLSR